MTFKSWRDDYTSEDVDTFLKEKKLSDIWAYECITGDGDLILRCKGPFQMVELGELSDIKKLFTPVSLMVEPIIEKMKRTKPKVVLFLTLSWNN